MRKTLWVILVLVVDVASCCVPCAGAYLLLVRSEPLTSLHKEELRPVMERYFAVEQNAYATLDTSEFETVATESVARGMRALISPEAGVQKFQTITIRDFKVAGYSSDHARVIVISDYKNAYEIDTKTGQRTAYPDRSEVIAYTLVKVDRVWKVAGMDSVR